MKPIKRLILILILLITSTSLISCGNEKDNPTVPTDTEVRLEILQTSYVIVVDETIEITFTTNIDESDIVWESMDEDIIKVENNKITGLKRGIGTIYVHYLNIEYLITVKVNSKTQETIYRTVTIVDGISDDQEIKVKDRTTILSFLKNLYNNYTNYNYDNYNFIGWYLDSDYKKGADLIANITSDITLYAKYNLDEISCEKIAINNVIAEDYSFVDKDIVQVFSPSFNDTTNCSFTNENNELEEFSYKDQFMIEVKYNFNANKHYVTNTYSLSYDKEDLLIPYDGFIISLSSNMDKYDDYVSYFKIGSVITLDNYSINVSKKIYIDHEIEKDTSEFSTSSDFTAKFISCYDATNQKYLYQKNADSKAYPASTTKVITALVALKYGNINDIYTVGDELEIMREGSSPSTAGLKVGQKFTLRMLLYAMLLPSGNDASYTIARGVVKNIQGKENLSTIEALQYFNTLMNEVAEEIGATNSHFMVPDGNSYYENGEWSDRMTYHFVTANDMIKFALLAFNYGMLAQVTSTYFKKGVLETGEDVIYYNTNSLLNSISSSYYYPYAVGLKTGTTNPAGPCLVSGAFYDGRLVIIAMMNNDVSSGRYTNTIKLYNEIFGL